MQNSAPNSIVTFSMKMLPLFNNTKYLHTSTL